MSRRKPFEPSPKPTLQSILDLAGAQYRETDRPQKIRCILHDDRHPSMSVDLGQGLWNCQSADCGGGDAWTLLCKLEGLDFKGAVSRAAELGLPTVGGEPARPSRGRSGASRGARKGDWAPLWRRGNG